MPLSRHTLLLALIVTALAYGLEQWATQPPPVKPATVPFAEFSAERAFAVLRELLAEGVPHPVASDANRRVRERIETYLREHGIEHEVQTAWGCAARFNRCAHVENVVATVPGRTQGPYVALMAHYDSVAMAVGAGDDGAGLVTVLETARTLAAEGVRRNPLMLIITDAEEVGLLGAEAFFRQHPLAAQVGVVINIEGAGTSGASMVLRTAGASSTLVDIYRRSVAFPNANSLSDEVFKRMPNDTDFSVSMRAGVPGIDLAFAGEFTHYHTPNDNLENLDQRTLQHHGENMLPLARALLDADLATLRASEPSVYLQVFGIWLAWPAWLSWVLIVVCASLLITVAWRTNYPGQSGWTPHLLGIVSPVLVIAGTLAVGWGVFQLLELAHGTIVSWPAVLWPWRVVLFAGPALGGLAVAAVVNRYLGLAPALVFALGAWLLLAVLLAIYLPGAAGLLIAPLLFALLMVTLATLVEHPRVRSLLMALSVAVAVSQTLGIVMPLEQSQGYGLAVAVFPFIALFMVLLAPLVRGRDAMVVVGGAALITGVGFVGTLANPLYSPWRPQHVNVHYYQNLDSGQAWWSLDSPGPPPAAMMQGKRFAAEEVAVYPWSADFTINLAADASASGWRGPELETLADSVAAHERVLVLELTATRPVHYMSLVIPESAQVRRFVVEGVEVQPQLLEMPLYRGNYVIQLMGMRERPVRVTLTLSNTDPVSAWVADVAPGLPPEAQPLVDAREPLATPVHTADQSVVYRRVTL